MSLALSNRYRLLERIAAGGMGEVWSAHDERLDRPVAVKLLRSEYADEPAFLARFEAEARHTAALSHHGIAAVYDYGESDGKPYLVMELVRGEPLSALLTRRGRLSVPETLDIVAQTALALQVAHDARLVHRDIKPGNLLIRPDGTVKVTDFGIARALSAAPLTTTGVIIGTADYISPEQAAGREVTAATDIYSLGVVAYECLAGTKPFHRDSAIATAMAHLRDEPARLASDVPPPVAAAVMQMLAKDPGQRPANARELAQRLLALRARYATLDVVTAPYPTPTEPVTRPQPPAVPPATPTKPMAVPPAAPPATPTKPLPRSPTPTKRTRRGRSARWLPMFVIVVLIGGLIAYGLTQRQSAPHARSTPSPSAVASPGRSAPATVLVNASSYIGQPYNAVAAALTGEHLVVHRVNMASATAVPGTVLGVNPSGPVAVGGTVNVTVAVPAPSPSPKHKKKHGHG